MMTVRSDSLPFVLPLAVLSATLGALGSFAALPALGLTLAVLAFFRDPERISNASPSTALSPADGRVLSVRTDADGRHRVTIFLSVLNVHVARSPVSGALLELTPRGGGFAAAFSERADQNARVEMQIRTDLGRVDLTLFAGLVARRVLPWVAAPTALRRGQRIAIIRFGSRASVVLPKAYEIAVAEGDRVKAGETVIGRIREGNPS
jgi:phosphatidylserine decarboxylase